jgi:hypothetical protein
MFVGCCTVTVSYCEAMEGYANAHIKDRTRPSRNLRGSFLVVGHTVAVLCFQ